MVAHADGATRSGAQRRRTVIALGIIATGGNCAYGYARALVVGQRHGLGDAGRAHRYGSEAQGTGGERHRCDGRTRQTHYLWAAGSVVGYGNCTIDRSKFFGNKLHVDSASCVYPQQSRTVIALGIVPAADNASYRQTRETAICQRYRFSPAS